MNGVKVRVLVAGAYSNPDGRAIKAKKGDIIEVMGGEYVQSLRFDKFVDLYNDKDEQQRLQAELDQLNADLAEMGFSTALDTPSASEVKAEWDTNTEEPGGPSSPVEASKQMKKATTTKRRSTQKLG